MVGVGDAPSLIHAVKTLSPDLSIVDVRMPPTYIDEGLRAAIEIRRHWPDVALLELSQFSARTPTLDPQVVRQLVARSRKMDPLSRLTPRERDVLSLMAEGRSNTAIAHALVVSTRAVGKHIASIFMKLDLPAENDEHHRRVMAVVQYLNS